MKIGLNLIALLILIFSSCNSIRNEYSTIQDCYNSVKDMHYEEIVKVWGEPDYKDELSILPSSLADQQRGIKTYATITCIWKSGKVKISNSDCISLNFDVVEIAGGVILPSRVKNYNADCIIPANSNSNNYNSEQSLENLIEDNQVMIGQIQYQYSKYDTTDMKPIVHQIGSFTVYFYSAYGNLDIVNTILPLENGNYYIRTYYYNSDRVVYYCFRDGLSRFDPIEIYYSHNKAIGYFVGEKKSECKSLCEIKPHSDPYSYLEFFKTLNVPHL